MLALGEVLLRLSPEGNERLTQGTRFEKQLGGRSEETVLTRITWLEMTVQIPDWEFTITNMAQIPVNRRWFSTASILL